MVTKLARKPRVLDATGYSNSTLYLKIAEGTFTPGVKLGLRSVAWPEYEVDAINAARIAGKSDEEIRALVKELVAARKTVAQGAAK